ncbi:hypothetical protein BD309DRAFT_756215 [Dichomitus squalens]|uniref:Uncharacterized protein n=1 Tax=Dichomitus squalens TaxID=114155 RepID=A0A4Q9P7E9_9APHY|nr:hypothetical protein BD309DRAFT_756215 [Dichomitus squalens]TBU64891.1 hypothetical protein BD310DRAFT_1034571 [Dichomitus squalens]
MLYQGYDETFREIRSRNEQDQLAHGSWTNLEEYSGSVLDRLYLLLGWVRRKELVYLRHVLDSAKPVELNPGRLRGLVRAFRTGNPCRSPPGWQLLPEKTCYTPGDISCIWER